MPEHRGFSSYFGYLNGGEDYYWHDDGGGGPQGNRSVPSEPTGQCKRYTCSLTHSGTAHDATAKSDPRLYVSRFRDLWDSATPNGPADDPAYYPRYSTFLFAEKAVAVIGAHHLQNQQRATPTPLFLYLPFQAAHSPMQVPEEFQRQYPWYKPCQQFRSAHGTFRENKGYDCAPPAGGVSGASTQYCACSRLVIAAQVTALDSAIRNVTAKLNSTGLWDNTVLVFSGDNVRG
eukprot:COSAG01_NODE_18880_length_1047_cov_1.379747_1_plen_232_part_00